MTRRLAAPFSAAMDAEVIIVIGANPTVNHPVAATYFKNAAKQGAKLIVMDPRRQALSRHAWKHLAFKPGSFRLSTPTGWAKRYPQSAWLLGEEVLAWQKSTWKFSADIR